MTSTHAPERNAPRSTRGRSRSRASWSRGRAAKSCRSARGGRGEHFPKAQLRWSGRRKRGQRLIRQRYGLTYVARIEKLMKDRLAAAGLPTEPYTIEQTGKGKYVRGLANITELEGRSRKSEAWHAANIIDAIGYLRGTLAKKNAGEWLEK